VIYKRDQGCPGRRGKLSDACCDRCAHRTVGIGINCELNAGDLLANVAGAVAQDDHDIFNAAFAQVVDATLDDRFVSEGEEGLERAHAAGAAGGEKNGCTGFTRFHLIIL